MTARVTLKEDSKHIRREYKTHARAIGALGRWFNNNKGIAILYQPGQEPVVFTEQKRGASCAFPFCLLQTADARSAAVAQKKGQCYT